MKSKTKNAVGVSYGFSIIVSSGMLVAGAAPRWFRGTVAGFAAANLLQRGGETWWAEQVIVLRRFLARSQQSIHGWQ